METSQVPAETADQPVVPWGWSREFRMALYKPGTRVRRSGSWETVSHVSLRRNDLAVYLVGSVEPVDPVELELEPTVFTTERVPERY
ncbi:MAG: hypothetical protein JSS31_18220 [Proteobacteria bacterium]|nr:hypothetical protein [Pseudomonadota bacterium]MBS0495835.1 hypothetical protein [Pseudomonadota bacterium]